MKRIAQAFALAVAACGGFGCNPALGQMPEERRIVKEVVVKAAPEAVFKAWSTTEGITSFFGISRWTAMIVLMPVQCAGMM